jgi:glycosyltransferase involved in cell wall biosynthesis
MNEGPLTYVDIIIPFNRVDNFLIEAISSAKSSNGIIPRLILVNDSQKFVAPESLFLNASDLLVINLEHGYIGALKTGINLSTAPYVGFLDSDDLTDPDRFRLQISRLIRDDVDYVSSALRKFSSKTGKTVTHSVFGKIPKVEDAALLLLLGAHGADSSIVAKGESIRKTWANHSKYQTALADYGWLVSSLMLGHTLSHEEKAVYFYRSHGAQLSRSNSITQAWIDIWPLWKEFKKSRLSFLRNFNSIELSQKTALALTFPSALQKLDRAESKDLRKAINALLFDLTACNSPDLDVWETTLWRRYVISSRFLGVKKHRYLIQVMVASMIALLKGIKTRPSKAK